MAEIDHQKQKAQLETLQNLYRRTFAGLISYRHECVITGRELHTRSIRLMTLSSVVLMAACTCSGLAQALPELGLQEVGTALFGLAGCIAGIQGLFGFKQKRRALKQAVIELDALRSTIALEWGSAGPDDMKARIGIVKKLVDGLAGIQGRSLSEQTRANQAELGDLITQLKSASGVLTAPRKDRILQKTPPEGDTWK